MKLYYKSNKVSIQSGHAIYKKININYILNIYLKINL